MRERGPVSEKVLQSSKIAVVVSLIVYTAIFAALGIDIMVRVWMTRSAFPATADVAVLLLYEGMRALTIAAGVGLAGTVAVRGRRSPHGLGVMVLLLLLVVAYAKATAFGAFPGYLQERVARWLLARGASADLLMFVFSEPAWAAMLAGAAFLRLAVRYPTPTTPEAVLAAGTADRSGMLRSIALAGTDVGALARRAAALAVRKRAVGPFVVWSAAAVAVIAQHFARETVAWAPIVFGWLGAVLVVGVPAVRAGLAASDTTQRSHILWFVEGGLVAAFALIVGGILSALPGGMVAWLSFVVLAVAPAIVLLCAATAVAPAGSVEPESALRVTAHWGATIAAVLTVVALIDTGLVGVFDGRAALRGLVAILAAGAVAGPIHTALRVPVTRLAPAPLGPLADH